MRASHWLLGLATASAIVAAVVSGCGGSTDSGGEVQDSGQADVTTDHVEAQAPETGSEAAPHDAAAEACSVDANLTTYQVPDAAIGDSGATTVGCYACIEQNCSAQVSACNSDCTCKSDVVTFVECVGGGGGAIACGVPLISGANPAAQALVVCLGGPDLGGSGPGCLALCGVNLPGDGGGAPEGGGDGATESGADASSE